MRFSALSTAVATLALCGNAVQAALSPSQMVDNIKSITVKSQALQRPAQQINVISGPLILIGQGPFPPLIIGFTDIVTTTTAAIAAMQGSSAVTNPADATLIFNAFREFVRVHQVLLNILIGKAGLFNTVPFIGAPVAAVLRQIEGVVDTVALGLISFVESRADDLAAQAGMLKGTLTICIDSYDGLSLSKRELTNSASFRALRV